QVRSYLEESIALEKLWATPVTEEMLHREAERMANESRAPARLRELYGALSSDPFLIQECLARPIRVDRLARRFHARDSAPREGGRGPAEPWDAWWKRTAPL